LDEVVDRFGGANPVRVELGRRLRRILEMTKQTGHVRRAFVWGSFITAKPEPGDIDVLLVMSGEFRSEQCSLSGKGVFNGEAAERLLGATVLWTPEDVPAGLLSAFLDQWQMDRTGRRGRIVEVLL
jgi:hypothetical protein